MSKEVSVKTLAISGGLPTLRHRPREGKKNFSPEDFKKKEVKDGV
jgi:hypothetical protein